ncbi:MAG: electron transport complex subunit RsxC [Candidatus Ratteibacteria bacterium]
MADVIVKDLTKFRLKQKEELVETLSHISSISLLWCEKCFTAEELSDKDIAAFKEISDLSHLSISQDIRIPFLCNRIKTSSLLQETLSPETKRIAVASCGIGIQTISSLFPDLPIIALTDSIPQSLNATSLTAFHGITLAKLMCAGCGNCVLTKTAGICPVTACAKSLLHGPCGGAKNGMCEVSPERECAWEKIFSRLEKQKKKWEDSSTLHNFAAFSFSQHLVYRKENALRHEKPFYGGVHPPDEKKSTESSPLRHFSPPEKVILFLSQHAGMPAKPLVQRGDSVCIGEKIADADGLISLPLHTGISGTVRDISTEWHPILLQPMPAIIIENNGKNLFSDNYTRFPNWKDTDPDILLDHIRETGIAGLGGAMFPTNVKLSVKKARILIINGCECEPFLTGDTRLMIERSSELMEGCAIAAYLLGVKETVVAMEENSQEAFLSCSTAAQNFSEIRIEQFPTAYPQGAEKMLVQAVTDEKVPKGKIPPDIGIVILNAGTVIALRNAIIEGKPLIERTLTVSGPFFREKGNFIVTIGTPLNHIFHETKTDPSDIGKEWILKMGGPMMGTIVPHTRTAVIKGTTGLISQPFPAVKASETRDCIRCGRCVDVCPMKLLPLDYVAHAKREEWKACKEKDLLSCIECGCCNYICASKIDILSHIKKAKHHAYYASETRE